MKRNILNWMSSAALALAAMAGMSACTDDLGWGGNADLGEKKHTTLSVPLGSSSPMQVSRSDVNFAQDAMVKIDCYWIGIFDAETHELLGSKWDNEPRKSDGTRWTVNNESVPYTVDGIEIDYYENSPYAYILGVVNYRDVKAKKVGEVTADSDLIDLLTEANTFEDVTKIVIDTESADEANRARGSDWTCPVMMGYYSTAKTVIHPQLNPDGSIFVSNLPDMAGTGYVSPTEVRASLVGTGGVDFNLSEGSIRLQRLLSEVNVYVEVPDYYYSGSDYNYMNVNAVRYRVQNTPNEIYLMERATSTDAFQMTDKNKFLDETPNSADYSANYNFNEDDDRGWITANNWYYDSQREVYVYQFRYQHYENKHYGGYGPGFKDENGNGVSLDGNNFHSVREQRFEDATAERGLSNVFRILCPSKEQDWNNYASYFELELNFGLGDTYTWTDNESKTWGSQYMQGGTVRYTIHEGATSWPDGQAYQSESKYPSVFDPRCCDFQTVRNTQYLYTISIGGSNGLELNVTANDFDEDPNYHNDGITGSTWYTNLDYLNNSTSSQYYDLGKLTPEAIANLKWIYLHADPSKNSYQYWGTYDGYLDYNSGVSQYMATYIRAYNNNFGYYSLNSSDVQDPEDASNPLPEGMMDAVKVYKGSYYNYSYEPAKKYPYNIDNSQSMTLREFIKLAETNPNAPFLQLNSSRDKSGYNPTYWDDQIFWIGIEPWYLSGDGIDYEQYNNYERMFYIFSPETTDADGCTVLGKTQQFLQRAYDNRKTLYSFNAEYSNHDAGFSGGMHSTSYFDHYSDRYYTYWCGAPGTITWFYVQLRYNSNDSEKELPGFEIKLGHKDPIYIPAEDVIVYSSSGNYKYVRVPLYIPDDWENTYYGYWGDYYGYMDVSVTPKFDPSQYRPVNAQTYNYGFFMQRKRNSGPAGTVKSTADSYQWLFSSVDDTTYGYGKIWQFYNDGGNAYNSFEFGGLTVVNGTSDLGDSNKRAIGVSSYKGYQTSDEGVRDFDVLTFAGGYGQSAPPYRGNSSEKMMLKFWVDRPGEIYLSYGYPGYKEEREWRAYWRSYDSSYSNNVTSTTYLHWPNVADRNNLVIIEEKGIPESGHSEADFWPATGKNGKFEKPVEVCIYMANSSGYIRSIEFRPYELANAADPQFPNEWVMPVPSQQP